MLTVPKWTEFPKYPVVGGTALLAIVATIAWWTKTDMSMLLPSAEIQRGHLWTLFTGIFLHVNVVHLLFNVYWLWIFGTAVEQTLGHAKTALIFVFLAVASSAFEFALDQGGVGLSGLGYGLFGMLWYLSKHDDRFRGIVGQNITTLFVGWFLLCVVTTVTNVYRVGNVAHGAGALLGGLIGYSIATPQRRLLVNGGLAALLILGILGATLIRPWVNVSGMVGYDEARLGYDSLLAQDNDRALYWLKDASKLQPRVAEIWFDLGIAYSRAGNSSAAKTAYQHAHDISPENSDYSKALSESQ